MFVRNWLFFCCLFYASVKDLKTRTIPDFVHLMALLVFFAAEPFLSASLMQTLRSVFNGLIMAGGILLLTLFMDRVLKKNSLGGGDIKLCFVMGVYLPPLCFLGAVLTAAAAALAVIMVFSIIHRKMIRTVPFGPFLAAGTVLMLLYGSRFIDWYSGIG